MHSVNVKNPLANCGGVNFQLQFIETLKMSKVLEGPTLKQNFSARTFGELFFTNASKHGARICQIDATSDKKETFISVKQRSVRMAIHLEKKQIKTTDVVAFCTRNSLDNIIPLIATFYLGAKVASLDPALSTRHLRHLLSIIEAKIIFVESSSVKLISESLETTELNPEVIVFGSQVFEELLKPEADEDLFRPVKVDENDVALFLFSSGSTGLPKAISHSHRSFFQALNSYYFQMSDDAIVLLFYTLYWIGPLVLLCLLLVGGQCRIIFNHEFSPNTIYETIEKYKVTGILAVPIDTYQLTNFEDKAKFDVSSLRYIFSVGTPFCAKQFLRVQTQFPTATIYYLYGMSECGPVTRYDSKMHSVLSNNLESCGKLVPGVTVKIVDPDNEKILSANEKGEIRVKSLSVMVGYYKSSNSDVFDSEGFLKTGDVGYYDEDEWFYVVGRTKEMFKYRCLHIVPAAIESVLMEHPAVKEAVVFGVPKEEVDYLPAACIAVKENCAVKTKDIEEFVAKQVSDFEKLRGGIFVMKELPKTPSGKLSRKEVEALVLGQKKYV